MTKADCEARIAKALEIAVRLGGVDGSHHLKYVIDQMVRALTGCPDVDGIQGESDDYLTLVALARAGEDGPDTYEWDVGIPP